MNRQTMKYLYRSIIILDIALTALALFLAYFVRLQSGLILVNSIDLTFGEYMAPLYFLIPTELILFSFFELYKTKNSKTLIDELANILKAKAISLLLFLGYLFIFQIPYYSRWVVIFYFIFGLIISGIVRIAINSFLKSMAKSTRNPIHVILVGYSELAIEYAKRIHHNSYWGHQINGVFDNQEKRHYVSLYKNSVKILGNYQQLEHYLETNTVDEVIITLELKEYSALEAIVDTCEKHGVLTRIIPDYYRLIPAKPEVEEIDGLPIIGIRKVPLNDFINKNFKRITDVFMALVGLINISPLLLLITILIKISSTGPIIYKQTRIGLNRKEFEMYKFRSMIVQDVNSEKKAWTIKDDPRVTKIGRFIRRTSLDELPQLLNVIKGDMSLIGPRPERPHFVEQYKEIIPKYMVKHQVRPGMTGWAQIHGWRGDTSIRKRIEYDLYYIENWSIKMEIQIFFMTFWKGFVNKNGY